MRYGLIASVALVAAVTIAASPPPEPQRFEKNVTVSAAPPTNPVAVSQEIVRIPVAGLSFQGDSLSSKIDTVKRVDKINVSALDSVTASAALPSRSPSTESYNLHRPAPSKSRVSNATLNHRPLRSSADSGVQRYLNR